MKMLNSIRAGLAPGLARVLTLLALASTSASAAQVSYTSTLSIKPTGWTNTVSLPQFDPALGTLLGVSLRVDSTFRSVSRVENTTPVPAPQTVSGALGSLVTYNPSALPLISVAPVVRFTNNLAAYDSLPDYGGSSGVSNARRVATATATQPQLPPFTDFEGTSQVDLTLAATATGFCIGPANFLLAVTPEMGASITVIYDYQEPTTPTGIGDLVWNDYNGNGVQEPGEPGLPGVTVSLLDETGMSLLDVFPTVTDANGAYSFSGIPAGNYYVVIEPPAGFVPTYDLDGVDASYSAFVSVSAGQVRDDVDFGLAQLTSTVGDRVWNDANANGIQDLDETGIAGVTVDLKDATDTVIASTSTDANGTYGFSGIAAGTYTIAVSGLPSGYVATYDADGLGTPAATSLSLNAGEVIDTIDFGFQSQNSGLGDRVWQDRNGNGLQEPTEPGLAGVTVELRSAADLSLVASTTTDANGIYGFSGLAAGDYLVVVSAPAGFQPTHDLDGTGSPSQTQVLLASDEIRDDIDFGYAGGSLGDRVWSDANADGIQDASETGIPGATVTLSTGATTTTDANGYYTFGDLPAGTYTVNVSVPAGWVATFDTDGIASAGSATVTLAAGQTLDTVDFGYQERTASVGDRVWRDDNGDGIQDGGEPGLEAVVVELRNAAGDLVLQTATTDANGFYQFSDLAAGTYTVCAAQPNRHVPTFDADGSAVANCAVITLATGEARNDADFGYQPLGTIGNLVWLDLDESGTFEPGTEPGLGGVTVTVSGTGGTFTTVTDENGAYLFDSLPPGTYTVSVTPPEGVTAVYDVDGIATLNLATVTLSAGGEDLTVDFGYNVGGNLLTADIAGRVWDDLDANGVPNAPETGLPGLPVALVDMNGIVVASQLTDGSGFYAFNAIAAGTYRIAVTPGQYWGPTFDIDGTGTPNEATTSVDPGQVLNGVDFGYLYAPPAGSIGDRVWNDANGNGLQDPDESGLANVFVEIRDEQGAFITSATTDASGLYTLSDVDAGNYVLSIVPPAYYEATGDLDGVLTPNIAFVTLAIGQDRTDVDFGLIYNPPPALVGDRVWIDANSNGIQDPGESGLAGLTVNLLDSTGSVLATATTDGAGAYAFSGLQAGTYTVAVTSPLYYIPTFDFDGIATTNAAAFTLSIGETNETVDFGFVYAPPLGHIGDRVWIDANADGIQDLAESGMTNITVTLRDSDGQINATTTTDSTGYYHFSGLAAGNYSVAVTVATNALPTFDLDGITTANVAAVTLGIGEDKEDVDFGFQIILPPTLASIGDRVWIDDGNGVFEPGENGLTNAIVVLRNLQGTPIATNIVAADGAYLFEDLEPGTYTVTVTPPANYFATYDLDGLTTPDNTTVTVNYGDDRRDVDFAYAFVAPDPMIGRIGDRVWLDANGNGIAESIETGIAGVTVRLLSPAGTQLDVATTDSTGFYEFVNLAGGTYRVVVTPPAGFSPTYDADGTATANNAVVILPGGVEMLDIDFGYLPPAFACIGDRVWIDANSNGIQNSSEVGLANARVVLLNSTGTPIRTNTTSSTGAYLFNNVPAGTYTVVVTAPVTFGPTWDVDGISTPNRSTVTVAAGENRLNVDFGYVACAGTGRIGDLVWIDSDGDGTRDSNGCRGTESGLPCATVRLFDANGFLLATQQTDNNGRYQFTGLFAGLYSVTVTPPSGYTPTYDLDGLLTPNTATLSLANGQTRSDVDFGYIRYCPRITTGTGCTPGFWRNQNGQSLLRPYDFAVLNSLKLVNDSGSDRDFTSSLSSNKSAFASWLQSSSAVNMSRQLSIHLACFQLNVLHGFYQPGATIPTPGIGSGSMTASALITAANTALIADGNTPAGDPNRVSQERLKNALDAANQAARR
jgi:hypothetical protein